MTLRFGKVIKDALTKTFLQDRIDLFELPPICLGNMPIHIDSFMPNNSVRLCSAAIASAG